MSVYRGRGDGRGDGRDGGGDCGTLGREEEGER